MQKVVKPAVLGGSKSDVAIIKVSSLNEDNQ